MPSAAQVGQILHVASIFGSGLAAISLYRSHLQKKYRFFFAYLIFRVLCMSALEMFNVRSNEYYELFCDTEPLVMIFYIVVVIELYRLVLERFQGLYTLGRWAMYIALVISVAVSILTLLPKIGSSKGQERLFYIMGAERGVDLSLTIFILLIVAFLSRYPIPLSRNVIVHTVIYTVFFLSNTLALLLRGLIGYRINDQVSVILMVLSCACAFAWWLLLSAKGEEVHVQVPKLNPDSEQRILQQLDSLNATLLKVSRN